MRKSPAVVVGIAVAITTPLLCLFAPGVAVVLHSCEADYIEDEQSGRRLARLDLALVERRGEARLRVVVQATGPRVDPIPGFRGVAGGNHITARELGNLVQDGELMIVSQKQGSQTPRTKGAVRPGRRGRIVERQLRSDGALDLHAESPLAYLLQAECETTALSSGVSDVYLVVKGVPRLYIECEWSSGSGKIRKVESLSGHNLDQ